MHEHTKYIKAIMCLGMHSEIESEGNFVSKP